MLTWHYITQNDYLNMNEELKTADKLFFIKDTKEIFCGVDAFKDYVIVYTNEPTTNYVGRLYVNGYTLESKIYDSGNWISVVSPVRGYEVKDYISNDDIAYISYDNTTKLIIVTFIDGTIDTISADNLIIDLVYGKSVGRFAIDYIYALSTNHSKLVDLQNYIDDITYNQNSKNITISFVNKNSMSINIDECIEDSDNDIVGFIVTGNMFVTECILASNEDNMIIENENTYVICKNNYNVISDNTEGSTISSVNDIVNSTVEDIVNTLQTNYYEYNFSVGSGHENEIIVADDTGIPYASGMKIGEESFASPPAEDLVATESGVAEYVANNAIPVENIVHYNEMTDNVNDASDEDVVSEKAFIETVKWRVIGDEGTVSGDDGEEFAPLLIDKTLTKSGMAADAKVVGDKFVSIYDTINTLTQGKSAYQVAVDNGFEGSEEEWLVSLGGKSAYQVAVDNGFEGSEEEWLASLGGKSAYQVAVDNGFKGTEKEWLESLKGGGTGGTGTGEDGKSAYEIAIDNGFEGSEEEWLESLKGKDGTNGKSAYELALDSGFDGSIDDWFEFIKGQNGEDGNNGKSAYQVAVYNGFEGSEEEWLESLKGKDGTNGKSAYEIAIDNGFEGSEEEWLESLKSSSGTGTNINGSYVSSINGKTGAIELAKSDVGLNNVDNTSDMDKPVSTAQAQVIGDVINAVNDISSNLTNHNTSSSSHSDIRNLISNLTDRLNALADSDDTTLDQMSELVSYIKSNKTLIENVTTNKISVDQIVDDLNTNVSNKPLSAAQGVILKGLINNLQSSVDSANTHANSAHAPSNAQANQNAYSKVKIGSVTLSADSETATLTLVGNNITITPTTGTGTITISIDKDDVVAALGYTPPTTNTTYSVVSTTANGLAPKRDGSTTKFLRADGTWAVPPDTNTTYTHPTTSGNKHIPSGGSSGQILRWSADGTAAWGADNNTTYGVVSTTANGLAPKCDGSTTKFLRGDGTWAVPPDTNTTYSVVSTSADGLAPKTDGSTTKFLRADGTWAIPAAVTVDTALSSTSTNPVQNKAVYAAINNVKSKTLTEHLASEAMILSSLQYGSTLPTAGTPGRIFFKKVSN